MAASAFDIGSVVERYAPDRERQALARRRQCAVWEHRQPDAWPIHFNAPLTPAQQAIPAPDLRAAFYDADVMICGQMRAACSVSNARADGVPSIRANLGTGTLLSCVGLEQEVFTDKMPWLREHLTRQQAAALTPDDIRVQGTFARALEYMARFKEVLGDSVAVFCADTQGPFDLAHLMLGDELFYALHDDPAFVHHVMELCLELGIRAHRWMKEVSGEPLGSQHHSNGLYAENMGIRICEDTTVLISPAAMHEFALPYTRRLAQAFGGAWMHYCGRNDELTQAACDMPEIRGLNVGHIPGHEHDHPFEEDMARCLAGATVYWGAWPRRPGESGRQFLRRMHHWASQGCLICFGNAALAGDDGFAEVWEARDFWYSL